MLPSCNTQPLLFARQRKLQGGGRHFVLPLQDGLRNHFRKAVVLVLHRIIMPFNKRLTLMLGWGHRLPNCAELRLLSVAGGAYWPLTTYPCPFLEPFPSAVRGAHRPLTTLCPPTPYLAYPYLPTRPSFPLGGCANGAPGLSLFHCSVLGPHRGGQLPSPLGQRVQVDTSLPWMPWGWL